MLPVDVWAHLRKGDSASRFTIDGHCQCAARVFVLVGHVPEVADRCSAALSKRGALGCRQAVQERSESLFCCRIHGANNTPKSASNQRTYATHGIHLATKNTTDGGLFFLGKIRQTVLTRLSPFGVIDHINRRSSNTAAPCSLTNHEQHCPAPSANAEHCTVPGSACVASAGMGRPPVKKPANRQLLQGNHWMNGTQPAQAGISKRV